MRFPLVTLIARLPVVVAALATTPARTAAACPAVNAVVEDIVANEPRARADVTDRFRCSFPEGLSFNDAALVLETNGFDLLNRAEPMFHLWRLPGEEFVSRRSVQNGWSGAEVRIILHMKDKKVTRLAAQYFLDRP